MGQGQAICRYAIAVVVALVYTTSAAQPQVALHTIADYRLARLGDQRNLSYYLAGLLDAYSMANSRLEVDHRPLLYCLPERMPMSNNLARGLIDLYISQPSFAKVGDDISISAVLLAALRNEFPCK